MIPERGQPAIRGSFEQLRALSPAPEAAAEQAIAACMALAGWSYEPLPRDSFTKRPLPASWTDDDRVRVGAAGYELLAQLPPQQGPENAGRQGLEPAQDAAFEISLNGAVEDYVDVVDPVVGGTVGMAGSGCRASAVTDVFGSVEEYLVADSLLGNLHLQAMGAAASSPEFAALDEEWHGCVRDLLRTELPDDVEAPWQAVVTVLAAVDRHGPGALTSGASGRLAAADARCRRSTGHTTGTAAVEDRYLTAWYVAYGVEVEATRTLYERALTRLAGT